MSDPVLDLDRRMRMPLIGFRGERPPAPEWFEIAIAEAPERSVTPVEGAEIETLVWGERGRPGLLFLHGGMANADWYAHIAPFFAKTHRVAALSMSGAGRSSWRERYDVAQYAREMAEVARVTGLFEAGPPVFAAHSFGSRPLLNAVADPHLQLKAAVMLDAAVSVPRPMSTDILDARPHQTYASFKAALERFRLMPYQVCDNSFIVDYIGRQSLHAVTSDTPDPEGSAPEEAADSKAAIGANAGERWTWRSDPFAFHKLSGAGQGLAEAALRIARCPMAFVYGDRSAIVRPDNLAHTRAIAPPGTIFTSVPDAAHHIFLDQPLAVVAALRALLATMG